jgi:hypothetical protein
MVWLIIGLLLVLAGGLAVVTRWGRRRPVADDTLTAELLGPPAAGGALPAPTVREDAEPPPAPAAGPRPSPAARPAGEGDWLETQLAWISAWSVRMHRQITATTAGPQTGGNADHRSAGPSRAGPGRCVATTAKGSQCKLAAEPGDTRCAIHANRARP